MDEVTIKYKRRDYEDKLSKLKNYYIRLDTHLQIMERLKDQISVFWNDANAEEAKNLLNTECQQVKAIMREANELANFYATLIEDVDEHQERVKSILQSAQSLLSLSSKL